MPEEKTEQQRRDASFFEYLNKDESHKGVILVGIQVPFFQLMWFLVKLIIAAVPAIIIAFFIIVIMTSVLGSLASGLFDNFMMSGNISHTIR